MTVCDMCKAVVGGGAGGLFRHQQGLACKVKAAASSSEAGRKRARVCLGEDTPVIDLQEIGNFADFDVPDSEDYELQLDPPEEEDDPFLRSTSPVASIGEGPVAVAASRFREIESRMGKSVRSVRGLDGEELNDCDLADVEEEEEDELTDEEGPEVMSSTEEYVLHSLMSLVWPSDGRGAGLKAEERKRAYKLADACLALSSNCSPPLTVSSLIRKFLTNKKDGTVDTDRLFELYMEGLTMDDGWATETFSVATGHIATARWNTRIIDTLTNVVVENWEFMKLKPEYDGAHFGHPVSGVHMYEFEKLVRRQQTLLKDWDEERDFVLLLVLFSDSTHLVNKGSLSAHPVTLSVANLPQRQSMASQTLLGYLGEFDRASVQGQGGQNSDNLTQSAAGNIRRALMSEADVGHGKRSCRSQLSRRGVQRPDRKTPANVCNVILCPIRPPRDLLASWSQEYLLWDLLLEDLAWRICPSVRVEVAKVR